MDFLLVILSINTLALIINSIFQATLIMIISLSIAKFLFPKNINLKFLSLFCGLSLIIICPIISNFNFTNKKAIIIKAETFSKQSTQNSPSTFQLSINEENHKTLISTSFKTVQILYLCGLISWIIGSFFILINRLQGYSKLKKTIKAASPVNNNSLIMAATKSSKQISLKQTPNILLSNQIRTPMTSGLINPIIILPEYLLKEFNLNEIKSVLIHEMAHIRRRDAISGILQTILSITLWFHPIIYFYNKEMDRYREALCDDYVTQTTKSKEYAQTLLAIAEKISLKNSLTGAFAMTGAGTQLKERVINIMTNKKPNTMKRKISNYLLLTSILLGMTFVSNQTQLVIAGEKNEEKAKKNAKVDINKAASKLINKGKRDLNKALSYTDPKSSAAQEKFKSSLSYFKKAKKLYKNSTVKNKQAEDNINTIIGSIFYLHKNGIIKEKDIHHNK